MVQVFYLCVCSDWVHDVVCSCISPLEDKVCYLYVFFLESFYVLVTKYVNPLKILLRSGRNPRSFWGKVSLFVCLFNQSLSQIKLLPNQLPSCQLGYQADYQKGIFPEESLTCTRKASVFCQTYLWNWKHQSLWIQMLRKGKDKRRENS